MKGSPDALEAQIIHSWNTNARPWARAIQAGIDAVPALIAEAAHHGVGQFQVGDYGAVAERQLQCGPFDAAVCNFSPLGKESVESLLGAVPGYIGAGHLIIQTLHPVAACGKHPYRDGWRAGSWSGFGATDWNCSSAANPRRRNRTRRPPSFSYARLASL